MEKRKFLLPDDFSDYDDSSCSEDNPKQNIVAVRQLPLIDLTADDHDSLLEVTSTPIDSIRKIKLEVDTSKRIKLELLSPTKKRKFTTHFNDNNVIDVTIDLTQVIRVLI
jgi:hypothetical protein